jgi:hypothetical protein
MTDKDKIFEQFLEAYLEKVKKILPDSYRARQLNVGGLEAKAVYIFETKFLKEPFMNVFKSLESSDSERIGQIKRLIRERDDAMKENAKLKEEIGRLGNEIYRQISIREKLKQGIRKCLEMQELESEKEALP